MNNEFKINKRRLLRALLLMLIAFLLAASTGCSRDSNEKDDIDVQELASGIQDIIDSDKMTRAENPSRSLKRFFGLNTADFEDVVIYSPASSMDVSELVILKLSDKAQIELVEAAIEGRIASQIESFSGYGPEQCALLEDYIIRISDDIVFYTVGENSDELRNEFLDELKNRRKN